MKDEVIEVDVYVRRRNIHGRGMGRIVGKSERMRLHIDSESYPKLRAMLEMDGWNPRIARNRLAHLLLKKVLAPLKKLEPTIWAPGPE